MPVDKLVDRLQTATTRRTVVKTGTKLAYAAPLVAASFKLSGQGALAVSPGVCDAGENCAEGIVVSCGPDDRCACVRTRGGFTCVERRCTGIACGGDDDCDDGLVCISAPGCCGDPDPFCGVPCGRGGDDDDVEPDAAGTGWR